MNVIYGIQLSVANECSHFHHNLFVSYRVSFEMSLVTPSNCQYLPPGVIIHHLPYHNANISKFILFTVCFFSSSSYYFDIISFYNTSTKIHKCRKELSSIVSDSCASLINYLMRFMLGSVVCDLFLSLIPSTHLTLPLVIPM